MSIRKLPTSTEMKIRKFTYSWKILNFDQFFTKSKTKLTSSTFSEGETSKWRLILNSWGSVNKMQLSLYLNLVSCKTFEPIRVKYKFCVLTYEEEECNIHDETVSFSDNDKSHGFNDFMSEDYLWENEPLFDIDNGVTILCEITMLNDAEPFKENVVAPITNSAVLANLSVLFEEQKFCDVTLVVGETEFPAHKYILAARSPVFSAMFEHDYKESENNRVEITDILPEVLKEMLWFIYAERTENLSKMAENLLVAADKYALEMLKIRCEQELSKSLTVENAAHMLALAETYNACKLKESALSFVCLCTADVMNTEGSKSTLLSHPRIMMDILSKLSAEPYKK